MKSVLGLKVKDQTEADAHLIMQKMYFHDDGCDELLGSVAQLVGINLQRASAALSSYHPFFRAKQGGPAAALVSYYGLSLEGRNFVLKSLITKECPHCGTHFVCPDCGTVIE